MFLLAVDPPPTMAGLLLAFGGMGFCMLIAYCKDMWDDVTMQKRLRKEETKHLEHLAKSQKSWYSTLTPEELERAKRWGFADDGFVRFKKR